VTQPSPALRGLYELGAWLVTTRQLKHIGPFSMWRGLFGTLMARKGRISGTHYKSDEWRFEVRDLYPAEMQTACGSDDK